MTTKTTTNLPAFPGGKMVRALARRNGSFGETRRKLAILSIAEIRSERRLRRAIISDALAREMGMA